jgi:hypothetical protein
MNNTVKQLLTENKKALQFLHDARGFDFEKDFIVVKGYDKFTYKTVTDTIKSRIGDDFKAALYVKPVSVWTDENLHYVDIDDKFYTERNATVQYWNYDIDYFWGVGNFEDVRKHKTAYYYIVAQKTEYIGNRPAPRVVSRNERVKPFFDKVSYYYDSTRTRRFVSAIPVMLLDGSATMKEYKPNGDRVLYSQIKTPDEFIDKSGYFVGGRRAELKRHAAALRAEREKAAALASDFTYRENEINAQINIIKNRIAAALACAENSEDMTNVYNAVYSLKWAILTRDCYIKKRDNKTFASVNEIVNKLDDIEKLLGGIEI